MVQISNGNDGNGGKCDIMALWQCKVYPALLRSTHRIHKTIMGYHSHTPHTIDVLRISWLLRAFEGLSSMEAMCIA